MHRHLADMNFMLCCRIDTLGSSVNELNVSMYLYYFFKRHMYDIFSIISESKKIQKLSVSDGG